ncbi:MAG: methionyl-tRNA synthetase [Candidatus Xenolissoclinum pacificiensis L6]|uniref:Methionine--tRNA ligase n=1 Tax=Candidatus Xenolissoclinum pacificiensis L6 TaxID=1401685 RepID=W2V0R4_9RICK|nr:MAG: methionyl-tRNA synthetase [Candidatus Xenolissoclinum pacificiensis L6]
MNHNVYISTPIYYVNDKPHIGHAYTTVLSDVIARYYQFTNFRVLFSSGTDEHGIKIEESAKSNNLTAQQLVDMNSRYFGEMIRYMGCHVTDFIRTTETRHKEKVIAVWNLLVKKGYIYKGYYQGWYSIRDECFFKESELIDGKAPTGAEVSWVEEESYFFALSKFQNKLIDLYEKDYVKIHPEFRKNEVLSFLKSGLEDLSISRTNFNWGINVPDDSQHVIYVWIDALVNYITVCDAYERNYWENSQIIHVLGKDILRFHAVYFPALLVALEMKLPDSLIVHGWWIKKQEKISKSLKNAIDPHMLVEKYGVEIIRYYMIKEMKVGSDTNFSEEDIVKCNNTDLANNFGNLLQRTLMLLKKGASSTVPDVDISNDDFYDDLYSNLIPTILDSMRNLDFFSVLSHLQNISNRANQYIECNKPWELYKNDEHNFKIKIKVLLECIKCIYVCLACIMPTTSKRIMTMLGITSIDVRLLLKTHSLESGLVIHPLQEPLFCRL